MSANNLSLRVCTVACCAAFITILSAPVSAQMLSYGPSGSDSGILRPVLPQADDSADTLPPQLRRQVVAYRSDEPAGTIIIDTPHTFLYLTLGNGKAMRYGIGVGREGFTWSGVETISRKSEWPDWIPPTEMIARQPYLPRWVGGGPGNPLGARALYLGNTAYRIHGTNNPASIGQHVSSGCIRLRNEDIVDLYSRVGIGAKVVVLPNAQRDAEEERVLPITDQRRVSIEGDRRAPMIARIAVRPAVDQSKPRTALSINSKLSGLY